MKNKYYQPEIEEFHVGFEYESEELSPCGSVTEMVKSIIKEPQDIVNAFNFDDWHSSVRVKFLDEQDILDLGFEKVGSKWSKVLGDTANLYVREEDNLMLAHYPSINKVTIATRDYSKNNITIKGTWDDKQINLITVKNKSELKKVLKQIEL